jgi:2-dehydropantoate 2-reductase
MKVTVYGAGAVGLCLAARLAKGGAEVSVVARGDTLAAIRAAGITLHAPAQTITARVAASDDPGDLGVQDAVIVTVKAPSLPQIAGGLAKLVGPETRVAFAMNGIPWWYFSGRGGADADERLPRIDPGDAIRKVVAIDRAIGGVVYCGCDVVAPGVVHAETAKARLTLGTPDGGGRDAVEALAARMRDEDFAVEVAPDIRKVIWSKIQVNICSGLFGALTGLTPKDLYGDPACAEGVRRLAAEVGAIAEAMGHPTGLDIENMIRLQTGQQHKSSIVQDLEKGRPMEFDSVFGTPLDFAKRKGLAVPTLELLVTLARHRARTTGAYPG